MCKDVPFRATVREHTCGLWDAVLRIDATHLEATLLHGWIPHCSSRERKTGDWTLTENDGMARRPSRGVHEHAYTIKHGADEERVVHGTGTKQGAIGMYAHQ